MRENKGKSIIALPSEYIVIDTETTGLDFDFCNIIEVSAVKYSGGELIDKFSSLVKPPLTRTYFPLREDSERQWVERYVDEFITDLTGITNEMLESAPEESEVIPQFMEFIGDSVLIAHNAHFDINFLYDAAAGCGLKLSNDFIDTLRIARKVFPALAHHRLTDVATACGISQENAHRAETDCITTAAIYETMKAIILTERTEQEFISIFTQRSKNYKADLASVTANVEDIDDTNPIYGKVIVFTGALSSMQRKAAFQIVANLGGIPEDSITKKTNYLVIGNTEFARSVREGKTSKIKKAESLRMKGSEISIISENAFFDLISDYT